MSMKYLQNLVAKSAISSPFIIKLLGKSLLILDCYNKSFTLVNVFLI